MGKTEPLIDSASAIDRLRGVPGAKRALRWLTHHYREGSVVRIRRGPATGVRWARYHRYVNGYWLGVYELPLQTLLARELRPGGTFWDVGANAGFFSVLAAKLVGSGGQVMAFDPLPENVESIERQFELNPLAQFELMPAAVSDRDGTAELALTENVFTPHLASGRPAGSGHGARTISVRTVALDSIAGPPPALVKVDVEGAELRVLKGAEELLKGPTKWLIELHEGPDRDEVLALLEAAGHTLESPPGFGTAHVLATPPPSA
jgi:FkbM family methyltransferase